MPTGIGAILTKFGLPTTGAALEGDLATLLTSTTPEGLLAKGAVVGAGALIGQSAIKSVTSGLFGGKKTIKRKRSTRSTSRSTTRRRKSHPRYRSKAWMAHIRKMRKK